MAKQLTVSTADIMHIINRSEISLYTDVIKHISNIAIAKEPRITFAIKKHT